MSEYLFAIIACILGSITIFVSCTDANWFFSSKNVTFFVRTFGRKGARIFYFLLGVFLWTMAYTAIFIR